METIEKLLTFLNSYPLWAKLSALAGITFSVVVLILAPRLGSVGQNSSVPAKDGPIFLRIKGVKLFPTDTDAEVQVLVLVNGITYQHPSIGGVGWMKVGPDMSQKLIELPSAAAYEIRFEMKLRNGSTFRGDQDKHLDASPESRASSQSVTAIRQLPFKEEYKLYDVKGGTRSAVVRAVVSYEISQEQ